MDYVLVVKFSGGGGGLCPSCKIQRGGLCPSCKIHGGDFVHVYKNEQGGFCPGGILSYTHIWAIRRKMEFVFRINNVLKNLILKILKIYF